VVECQNSTGRRRLPSSSSVMSAAKRIVPLGQKVALGLIGRQRREARWFGPRAATHGTYGRVPRQPTQQKDRGDLAAETIRIDQLRQGVSIGRAAKLADDLLHAKVEQHPALSR